MKSNYALGLVVGVENMFTKGAKEIQEEYKRLSKSNAKLQENLKDVSAYKKQKEELKSYRQEMKKMGTPTEEAEFKLKNLTNSLSSYSRRLKKAGIDTSDLTFEQEKLQKQLNRTTQAMNKAGNNRLAQAGANAAKDAAYLAPPAIALAITGLTLNQTESAAAAQTNRPLSEIKDWRPELIDIETKTARSYDEILALKVKATQSGYNDSDANDLVMTTSQIANVFKLDVNEIFMAQTRMMKAYNISAERSADLITRTLQLGGDDKQDLLDTIAEYTPVLSGKGLSIDSVMAQLLAGKQSGAWNYDKMGDSIKESIQAIFTDVGEFSKLVGSDNKKGVIDELVKDKDEALNLKNAAYELHNALNKGEDITKEYANLMMLTARLQQTDKRASRTILQHVMGNVGAEDMGDKTFAAMAKASHDPSSVLGDYEGATDKANDTATTATMALTASLGSVWRSVSTIFADLENGFEGMFKTVSSGLTSISKEASENKLVAGSLAVAGIVASGLASRKALQYASKKLFGLNPKSKDAESLLKPMTAASGVGDIGTSKLKNLARGAGKIIKPLGYALTAGSVASSVKDGEYEEAAKFAGSIVGGVMGAKLGGSLGAIAGPWGMAAGGIAGGAVGSIFGEAGIDKVMSYITSNDKEESSAVDVATTGLKQEEQREQRMALMSSSFGITINPTITIESGAVVPADFESQLLTALRVSTPELTGQLSETLNSIMNR